MPTKTDVITASIRRINEQDSKFRAWRKAYRETLTNNSKNAINQNKLAGVVVCLEDTILDILSAFTRFAIFATNKARKIPKVNELERLFSQQGKNHKTMGISRHLWRNLMDRGMV